MPGGAHGGIHVQAGDGTQWDEVVKQTAEQRQTLDDLSRKKPQPPRDMAAEVDKLRRSRDLHFEGKLPEEKEMDKVFTEVSELAQKNNLNTESVRILKVYRPGFELQRAADPVDDQWSDEKRLFTNSFAMWSG